MVSNFIVLATTPGHVIVAKQVLLNVDEQRLKATMEALGRQHPGTHVTLLTEQDVDVAQQKFMEARRKLR